MAEMNQADNFKQLQILHGALMMGAIFISIVLGYLLTNEAAITDYAGLGSGFLAIAAAIMAVEVVISYLIWNKRQSNIPATNVATEKWAHYRSSCILRWAMLEGGIFLSVVLTYLEQNLAGFVITAIGLAFLFLARPSRDYVSEKYGLNF